MNKDVRKITDGAMMCAIVGVLLLIDRQFGGILADYLLFLFPLPMVFFAAKYGWKPSWMTLAAMVLLAMVISTPTTLFYVTAESLLGLVYGAGIHDKWDQHRLVVIVMVIGAVISVVSTVLLAALFGYDISSEVAQYTAVMNQAMEQTGLTLASAAIDLPSMIRNMILISAILSGVLQGLVTHMISRLMFRRLHIHVEPALPIQDYFPSKWLGYAGIAGLVAYYYSIYRPLADSVMQNVMQCLGIAGVFYLAVMGVIGIMSISIIRNPGSRKWIGFAAVLLLFMFVLPVAIFGFLYVTTDMHQRMIEGDSTHAAKNG
ncbi:MAG: DUF2232 domain-containing protein [Erysipelotrichia bacterium]|nr:DUF2232 domain-containing protein [Erysipelotrichia bacterium]